MVTLACFWGIIGVPNNQFHTTKSGGPGKLLSTANAHDSSSPDSTRAHTLHTLVHNSVHVPSHPRRAHYKKLRAVQVWYTGYVVAVQRALGAAVKRSSPVQLQPNLTQTSRRLGPMARPTNPKPNTNTNPTQIYVILAPTLLLRYGSIQPQLVVSGGIEKCTKSVLNWLIESTLSTDWPIQTRVFGHLVDT